MVVLISMRAKLQPGVVRWANVEMNVAIMKAYLERPHQCCGLHVWPSVLITASSQPLNVHQELQWYSTVLWVERWSNADVMLLHILRSILVHSLRLLYTVSVDTLPPSLSRLPGVITLPPRHRRRRIETWKSVRLHLYWCNLLVAASHQYL